MIMRSMVLVTALLAFLLPAAGEVPEESMFQSGGVIGLKAFTIITPVSQGKVVKWQEKLYLVNDGPASRLFFSGTGYWLSGGNRVTKVGSMGVRTSASPQIEKQLKKLEAKSIWCVHTLQWDARPTGDAKSDSIRAGVWDGEKLVLYSVPLAGRYFEKRKE